MSTAVQQNLTVFLFRSCPKTKTFRVHLARLCTTHHKLRTVPLFSEGKSLTTKPVWEPFEPALKQHGLRLSQHEYNMRIARYQDLPISGSNLFANGYGYRFLWSAGPANDLLCEHNGQVVEISLTDYFGESVLWAINFVGPTKTLPEWDNLNNFLNSIKESSVFRLEITKHAMDMVIKINGGLPFSVQSSILPNTNDWDLY